MKYSEVKMKCTLVIALVAAIVYPARAETQAVDWPAVSTRVDQIDGAVTNAFAQVISIAAADDAAVGADIANALHAAGTGVKKLLDQTRTAIRAQTLSEAEARQIFSQLLAILTQVQVELRDDFAKLSQSAQSQCREILYSAFAQTENLAVEIYRILAVEK